MSVSGVWYSVRLIIISPCNMGDPLIVSFKVNKKYFIPVAVTIVNSK